MTPKQQAKELLRSYSFIQYDQDKGVKLKNKTLKEAAKQCALICAMEIIDSYKTNISLGWKGAIHVGNIKFWQQVKEEINAL